MTQATSSFAQAAEQAAAAQNDGPKTDQLTGNNAGYDPLFGGEKLPSLWNKTHGVGTERTGIILQPPKDIPSFMYKAGGGRGAAKYWLDGKPTDKSVHPTTGVALDRVYDTLFVLQTDYRLTPEELLKSEMDEDDGKRGWFAGGEDLKAIKAAIRSAGVKNREALVGMRLTGTRTGQKVKGDFEVWQWSATLAKV